VLLIGINRPAKRNGWTPAMFQQLAEAYTRLDDEPELRVGLLHALANISRRDWICLSSPSS
jgi:enoyl-CoA hydratase/carnithine racemase